MSEWGCTTTRLIAFTVFRGRDLITSSPVAFCVNVHGLIRNADDHVMVTIHLLTAGEKAGDGQEHESIQQLRHLQKRQACRIFHARRPARNGARAIGPEWDGWDRCDG